MDTTTQFSLPSVVAAIEADDPAAIIAAYADDVVIEIQNKDRPPADPLVLRGRAALAELLEDVASRGLTHAVERAIADERSGAIQTRCTYPSGERVLCSSHFDLADGRIVRETRLEVWDG